MIENAEEFVRLRTGEDPAEYQRSAWDEADEETWFSILEHHPEMAFWVAHNRTISEKVIRALAKNPDGNVRLRVAQKRSAPREILGVLAHDADDSVRLSVACNPKADLSILRVLLDDPWESVRERVKQRLAATGK